MRKGNLVSGVLEGAGSLLKNTVAATFYSINKFTSSLSSGFSLLTFVILFLLINIFIF